MSLLFAFAMLMAPPMSDAQIKALLPSLGEAGMVERDGQYLHDLAVRMGAKRVLEIGTSSGYASLWLGMAMRKTGGKLTTLEIHEGHHAAAVEHFARTGLADFIDARRVDAVEVVPEMAGPFDLVFLNAGKNDYLFYFEQLLPKLRAGGAIVAHDVRTRRAELAAYLERVRSDARVRTEMMTASAQGMAITYRK